MGKCQEIFKDIGFLLKFIECIVIIVLAIFWYHLYGATVYGHHAVYRLLGGLFIGACFYFFFPVFIMMIMYAVTSFQDHMYELIICISGAISGGIVGIAYLLECFVGTRRTNYYEVRHNDYRDTYHDRYGYRDDGYGHDGYGSGRHSNGNLIILSVLAFLLMAVFIVDAIINGAQKKCKACGG